MRRAYWISKRTKTFKPLGLVVSNILSRSETNEALAFVFEILLPGSLSLLSGNEDEISLDAEMFLIEFHLVT